MAYKTEDEETVIKALIALVTGTAKITFPIGEPQSTLRTTSELQNSDNKIR